MPKTAHRWGFVGTGGIAATMAAALARTEGGELVSIASRDHTRAADFAARHGAARSYGGPDALAQLLEEGVDILYVATTHPQHHAPARAALRAGTPVLVEKPMTVSLAATEDLIALAEESSTFLMEAYWTRLLPGTQALLDLVASGRIGRVRSLHADFGFNVGPGARRFHDSQIGGGSLLDLGPYPLGLAVMLLGRAQQVKAVGSLTPAGVDEQISISARFGGGALASLSTTMVAHAANRAWVEGSSGTIELDPFLPTAAGLTVTTAGDEGGAAVEHLDFPVEHGHRLMLDHVHLCLDGGLTESPLVTHQWSLDVAELAEQALTQVGVTRNLEVL